MHSGSHTLQRKVIEPSQKQIQTQKYVVRIPQSVKYEISLDKSNGNTLWWEAIVQEMKNVRIVFGLYEGNMEDLPTGYQEVSCHIIFDVNMGDNFRCKA